MINVKTRASEVRINEGSVQVLFQEEVFNEIITVEFIFDNIPEG